MNELEVRYYKKRIWDYLDDIDVHLTIQQHIKLKHRIEDYAKAYSKTQELEHSE